MFKLAAVTAVASANTMAEFKETAELFTITAHGEEVMPLEGKAKALWKDVVAYRHDLSVSEHPKQFQMEGEALVHTKEFVALAKYVEATKKAGPTPQIKKFAEIYMAQKMKVAKAHANLVKTTKMEVTGKCPHDKAVIDVDNEAWIQFNMEYYKLREMQYYAGYKIPQVVGLRKHVTDVRHTDEFEAMTTHWKQITQTERHQDIVHREAEIVIGYAHAMHLSEDKWMDPAKSPVMFDAWHAIHLYFVAQANGDLEPMLDFLIDGKYDDEYVKAVDP